MDLLQDLFLTASLALILSFLVAKLVSFAMAAPDSDSVSYSTTTTTQDDILPRERLSVLGVQAERRVEFVQQTTEIVQNLEQVQEAVHPSKEFAEENCQLEISSQEDLKDEPGTVGFQEKLSEDTFGQEEREVECDHEGEEIEIGTNTDNDDVAESKAEGINKEKDEKSPSDDEDEDDWEGIERTELDKTFAAAARFVRYADDGGWLSSTETDVQMELYGLHKVATEGPCREPQPMAFMVSARAKWNAWQRLGNMNPDIAMEQYIALLSDKVPGWMEDHSSVITGTPDTDPKCTNKRNTENDSFAEGCGLTEGSNLVDKPKG